MLVGEESQIYIEAVDAEVAAIHRSRETIELPGSGTPTLPVQAFVCGIKKEEESQVLFALHSKSCKRNLIYSVPVVKKEKSGYEAALKAALEVSHVLGFSMESVNLKCSTAMREVVIRTIPVLLAPTAARKAVAQMAGELAELERMALQTEEDEAQEEAVGGLSPGRRAAREKARQERREEIKAAARRLAAEGINEEREAATRKAVRRLLASRFGVAGSPIEEDGVAKMGEKPLRRSDPAAAEVDATATGAANLPETAEQNFGEKLEIQRLAQELHRLTAEKASVEQRAAELAAMAKRAAEEAERERSERARLEAEKTAAERRTQELASATRQAELRAQEERAERERLNAEKTAAEQQAAELAEAVRAAELRALAWREEHQREASLQAQRVQAEKEHLFAAKAAVEQQVAAMAEAVRASEQQAEVERGERERLLDEKAAAEQRARELAEAVRLIEAQATASRTEKERLALAQADRERTERERLAAEKLVAERRAEELAEAVQQAERQSAADRAERERLAAEKTAAEQRAEELAKAARRAAELAEIARQATQGADGERREQERLEAEKARAERHLQMQPQLARQEAPTRAEQGRRRETLPSLGGLFATAGSVTTPSASLPPKTTPRPAISGALFQVDPELAVIAYDSIDDVLEVHQAISMTKLSLEDYPNQYCMAYIVAIRRGPGRQVHVAFRLTTSDRVLVYSPPSPSQDQEAYARAIQEAKRFLRVTGIEMENLPLGKSPEAKASVFAQIPVLRHRYPNASVS